MHAMFFYYLFHYSEGMCLRGIKSKEQEACDKVHALAIVQITINDSI